MMKRIAEASPPFEARMAGVCYFLTMLTAALTELFVHTRGALNFAVVLFSYTLVNRYLTEFHRYF